MPDREALQAAYGRLVTAGVSEGNRECLAAAFGAVSREDYLPAPPWLVSGRNLLSEKRQFETSKPGDIHDDVLVAIDPARRINNGQPSLWAGMLDLVDGAQDCRTVLHSGCGLGYYTAVIAWYFSQAIVEFDEAQTDLFREAEKRLSTVQRVRLRKPDTRYDAIFLSYGICRLPALLVSQMAPGCQLVAPVTDRFGNGRIVHFRRNQEYLEATPAMAVAFITDAHERNFPWRIEPRPARIRIDRHDIDLASAFQV